MVFSNTKLYCFSSLERHDALYVVGALDEAMELRGMRYHPIDIETSVIRAHKSVTEW